MSRYDWEQGELVLPAAAVASLLHASVRTVTFDRHGELDTRMAHAEFGWWAA